MASLPWPGVQHLGQKFEDTFLPGVTDEQMAIQAIRVSHQSPAHLSGLLRYWHDVLRIDRVDARPNLPALLMTVQEIVGAILRWSDASTLDGIPHLLPGRRFRQR